MITYLLRLLLLAFLVLGAITALRRLAGAKHRNKPAPKDKQADLWTGMSEHFEQLDQDLAAAKHWSRDELALAIEQYVFKLQHSDEDNTNLLQRITQQSDTVVPMVLKMLGNPDMQTRLRKEPRGEPALLYVQHYVLPSAFGWGFLYFAIQSRNISLDRWDFFFKAGGGPVLDIGPYYVTNLVQLIGPVTRVACFASTPRARREIVGPRGVLGESAAAGLAHLGVALRDRSGPPAWHA